MRNLRWPSATALMATVLSALLAVMIAGYLLDYVGLPVDPIALAVAAAIASFASYRAFRRSTPGSGFELASVTVVVIAAAVYLFWRAWPSLLPITDGPDLVHHLQLIHFIQRTHALPDDVSLGVYLVEMTNYTPGAHILAATIAAWLRVDALRVVHPIAAACVALKLGILYLTASRVIDGRGSSVHAIAAPVLAFVPSAYLLGSFFQYFFFAQVVSETFALGMLLAAALWTQTGEGRYVALFAVLGVAAFLAWPVWIGPGTVVMLAAILSSPLSRRDRALTAALAFGPIALVSLMHLARHAGGASIVGSSGAVTHPSVAVFGAWFLVLAAGGAIVGWSGRAGRLVVLFLFAVLAQAAVLAVLDRRAGSTSFYLPFKMMYLSILPGALLGAMFLARTADAIASRLPMTRPVAIVAPVIIAGVLAGPRIPLTRPHSPISASAHQAGLWALGHVPPECVDYFSAHWLTGYWLHLDVLGNPRISDRMRTESFEFSDTVGKWIEGRGLPYAIVEDIAAVPRDARRDMVPIHLLPPSAVVRNARPGSDPGSALCRGK